MEEKKKRNKDEFVSLLLDGYFAGNQNMGKEQCDFLHGIAADYKKNNSYLMKLYLAVHNEKSQIIDPIRKLSVKLDGSNCIFKYKEKEISLNHNELLKVAGDLVELTENILPLGSLVQLKKEHFEELFLTNKVEKLWVVITHRFLKTEAGSYYTYGGVVYPVGNYNAKEFIQFTPGLIDKIIQKGYRDEQDDAYVYLMKSELILEKGLRSAGFRKEEVSG